jgi:SAM-dependent methyltransferase
MNKFETIREAVRKIRAQLERPIELLDVGCRDCVLKPYVAEFGRYAGVDLFQNEKGTVDFVTDVSRGLPLESGQFDVVVALDLLEHLDNLQSGLDELLRVSRKHIIVLLPNMAHISYRMTFLRRGFLNEKYSLKFNQGLDRHRWLTIGSENARFAEEYAAQRGVEVETTWFVDSAKKAKFAKLCRTFGLSPDWWAIASIHHFRKR